MRRDAPQAFRTQERAVTAADYAAAAERRPDVQRAAATFRWTGSWHTVFVTPDRFGGAAVDDTFEARLRRHLERFRMAGYDLEVERAALRAARCRAAYLRQGRTTSAPTCCRPCDVCCRATSCPTARSGVFHPDNFTFGQPVYLSRVIAAAQAVEGVDFGAGRPLPAPGRPELDVARRRRDRDRRSRDRPARQQPQLPRARQAALAAGGGK